MIPAPGDAAPGTPEVIPPPTSIPTAPDVPAAGPAFKTGAEGEAYLRGIYPNGEPEVTFKTDIGNGATRVRRIDVLSDGIAHESKVGYTRLTETVEKQIAKDAWLIENGDIQGSTWHFFRSAVTGKIGAAADVIEALQSNGIKYVIHK